MHDFVNFRFPFPWTIDVDPIAFRRKFLGELVLAELKIRKRNFAPDLSIIIDDLVF
jgi:hypothetical protein